MVTGRDREARQSPEGLWGVLVPLVPALRPQQVLSVRGPDPHGPVGRAPARLPAAAVTTHHTLR